MYEAALEQELKWMEEQFTEFRNFFDRRKHFLQARWFIYSPDTMTKEGGISQNSTDLDAHKVLQDTIMKLVGVDDAFIADDRRVKLQGEFGVHLCLRILDLEFIGDMTV